VRSDECIPGGSNQGTERSGVTVVRIRPDPLNFSRRLTRERRVCEAAGGFDTLRDERSESLSGSNPPGPTRSATNGREERRVYSGRFESGNGAQRGDCGSNPPGPTRRQESKVLPNPVTLA